MLAFVLSSPLGENPAMDEPDEKDAVAVKRRTPKGDLLSRTIRLPEALNDALEARAELANRSWNALVVSVLNEWAELSPQSGFFIEIDPRRAEILVKRAKQMSAHPAVTAKRLLVSAIEGTASAAQLVAEPVHNYASAREENDLLEYYRSAPLGKRLAILELLK